MGEIEIENIWCCSSSYKSSAMPVSSTPVSVSRTDIFAEVKVTQGLSLSPFRTFRNDLLDPTLLSFIRLSILSVAFAFN